jgi:hypothetical protein
MSHHCAYINAEAPQARTLEKRAQTLARLMRERLTNKLSEDPEVTAERWRSMTGNSPRGSLGPAKKRPTMKRTLIT